MSRRCGRATLRGMIGSRFRAVPLLALAAAPAIAQEARIRIPEDPSTKRRLELTLADAMRLGKLNNTDLKVGEIAPLQAAEDVRSAAAVFEPEFFANASAGVRKDPTRNVFQPELKRTSFSGTLGVRQLVPSGGTLDLSYSPTRLEQSTLTPGFPRKQFVNVFTATYRQPLLRSAWSDYTLSAVRLQESVWTAASHRYGRTVQDVLLAVVRAYWDLVFARENYRVVVQALQLAQEQLRITNERIRVRELAERDRVADEAEVARRQEEVITAENEIRNREDALRRLLFDGQDDSLWSIGLVPVERIEIRPEVDEIDWRAAARVALLQRPDLKALRAEVRAAEFALVQAERDVLPRLDLVGSYTTDGVESTFRAAFQDAVGFDFPDWTLTLEMSVPIGNNAALAARDRARLELEAARRRLYAAEMDVTREVREAVRSLRTLALSIRAARESVRLAETDLETERQKLRVGTSTAFEVQRRNQALLDARTRLLRNQLDYRIARTTLLHVQGLLAAPPGATNPGEKVPGRGAAGGGF